MAVVGKLCGEKIGALLVFVLDFWAVIFLLTGFQVKLVISVRVLLSVMINVMLFGLSIIRDLKPLCAVSGQISVDGLFCDVSVGVVFIPLTQKSLAVAIKKGLCKQMALITVVALALMGCLFFTPYKSCTAVEAVFVCVDICQPVS